jgi:phytoene dehydrogenase-like protein
VLEASDEPGGGTRSAGLTLPGFVHDVCSSIHVFGRISPFFADVAPALARHGLRWIRPPAALGHPLDDGSAVLLRGDVEETARGAGPDGDAYRRLFGWLVDAAPTLLPDLLGPFHVPLSPPRAVRMARFGLLGLQPATRVARRFHGDAARALFAGIAAHSILPLTEPVSAAAALVLSAAAHVDGWPFPEGGAGMLPRALVAELEALGGRVETGRRVATLDDLPAHRVALFDTSPHGLAEIAGDRLLPAIGGGWKASATGLASSSSTSRSTARSRGGRRSSRMWRRSTSAGRSRRSPAARPRSPPAASRIGRSCC